MLLQLPEVRADNVLRKIVLTEKIDICPCFWSVGIIDDVAADTCADRAVIVWDFVLTEAGNCSEESAFALPGFADNCNVQGVAGESFLDIFEVMGKFFSLFEAEGRKYFVDSFAFF